VSIDPGINRSLMMNKTLAALTISLGMMTGMSATAQSVYAEWRDWNSQEEVASSIAAAVSELESAPPAAGSASMTSGPDGSAYREWGDWSDRS
jgi:hypothetical protein